MRLFSPVFWGVLSIALNLSSPSFSRADDPVAPDEHAVLVVKVDADQLAAFTN